MGNLIWGIILMGAGTGGQHFMPGNKAPLAVIVLGGFVAALGVFQVLKGWLNGPRVHPEAIPDWTRTALSNRRAMASSPNPEPYRPCAECGTMLPARTDRCLVCTATLQPAWQENGEWRLQSHGTTYRWNPFSGNWELRAAHAAGASAQ